MFLILWEIGSRSKEWSGYTLPYVGLLPPPSDVAVALLILVLAADALRHGLTARRAATLAVVGTAAVWLSHPSVFVLAGAGTTLIVHEALVPLSGKLPHVSKTKCLQTGTSTPAE